MKPLTEFENQVLRKVAVDARKKTGWAEPPRTPAINEALRHLSAHKMLSRAEGKWWLVRPSAKALRHIEALKAGKFYRRLLKKAENEQHG